MSGGVRQRTRAAPGAAPGPAAHRCSWPLLPPLQGLTTYKSLPVCSLCFGRFSRKCLGKLRLQSCHRVPMIKLRLGVRTGPTAETDWRSTPCHNTLPGFGRSSNSFSQKPKLSKDRLSVIQTSSLLIDHQGGRCREAFPLHQLLLVTFFVTSKRPTSTPGCPWFTRVARPKGLASPLATKSFVFFSRAGLPFLSSATIRCCG